MSARSKEGFRLFLLFLLLLFFFVVLEIGYNRILVSFSTFLCVYEYKLIKPKENRRKSNSSLLRWFLVVAAVVLVVALIIETITAIRCGSALISFFLRKIKSLPLNLLLASPLFKIKYLKTSNYDVYYITNNRIFRIFFFNFCPKLGLDDRRCRSWRSGFLRRIALQLSFSLSP